MMEKCTRPIDPWSWSNCEQFQATVTTPTPRQVAIINKEIDEFYLKVISYKKYFFSLHSTFFFKQIYRPYPGEGYNATFQALYEDITNSVTSCDQLEPTLDQLPLPAEISIHNKVFNGFIAFLRGRQDQINPAHIACALTRATIPFNTDIFFVCNLQSFSRQLYLYVCLAGCYSIFQQPRKHPTNSRPPPPAPAVSNRRIFCESA